jgi:hypothetical protein
MYFELDNDDIESSKRRSVLLSLIFILTCFANLMLLDISILRQVLCTRALCQPCDHCSLTIRILETAGREFAFFSTDKISSGRK